MVMDHTYGGLLCAKRQIRCVCGPNEYGDFTLCGYHRGLAYGQLKPSTVAQIEDMLWSRQILQLQQDKRKG